MQPKIHLNDLYPDGILAGFNAQGSVVVCVEVGRDVTLIMGTEHDKRTALEWHMSTAQDRRMRWLHTWVKTGFPCIAVEQ